MIVRLMCTGTADAFLDKQLQPETLQAALLEAGLSANVRLQEGYDHSVSLSWLLYQAARWWSWVGVGVGMRGDIEARLALLHQHYVHCNLMPL